MNDLSAELRCNCGRTAIARAADAGGILNCECGQSVRVPNLSQLRTIAGSDAYVTNPAEAIRKAQREGNDPAGRACLLCNAPHPVIYTCLAVCEQSHAQKTNEPDGMVRWIFLPTVLNILLYFLNKPTSIDRRGHDIEVTFGLPVCEPCTKIIGKPTRSKVYKELLDYYPGLALKIRSK
jgi:hypothetical protein